MKILEIVPQLSSGGGEYMALNLSNELCKQHDVVLVTLFSLENLGFYKKDLNPNLRVISLDKKYGKDYLLPFRLRKLIKEEKPEIVHVHLRAMQYVFYSALTFRKAKYFETFHYHVRKGWPKGIDAIIRKIAYGMNLIHPVTISTASEKNYYEKYGKKADLVFNGRGVPEDFAPSESVKQEFEDYRRNGRVLVHLARFSQVKRQDFMARVAGRLADKGYKFTLLMIGRIHEQGIADEVKKVGCPYIHLLGEKNNPLDYLNLADSFCLCSSREGMPMSLIEALGMGAIPVCTPVGGVTDIIEDGVNGFLSRDISEEAYYEAMERFLKLSDSEIADMKTRVKNSYQPFSMTECAKNYVKLFQSY